MPSSVVPNISALEETLDIPQLTQEEMDGIHIDWVIKPGTNDDNFYTKHLPESLQDSSIGIHDYNLWELREIVTDEFLMITHGEFGPNQRRQMRQFRNDFKPGHTILIGQGKVECLYVAEIASTYYFHPMEDKDICHHRRRICNIRKVPDGFTRRPLVQTLSAYKPL